MIRGHTIIILFLRERMTLNFGIWRPVRKNEQLTVALNNKEHTRRHTLTSFPDQSRSGTLPSIGRDQRCDIPIILMRTDLTDWPTKVTYVKYFLLNWNLNIVTYTTLLTVFSQIFWQKTLYFRGVNYDMKKIKYRFCLLENYF